LNLLASTLGCPIFTRAEARVAQSQLERKEGYVATSALAGVGVVVDPRLSHRTRQRGVLPLQLVQRARHVQHGNQNVGTTIT